MEPGDQFIVRKSLFCICFQGFPAPSLGVLYCDAGLWRHMWARYCHWSVQHLIPYYSGPLSTNEHCSIGSGRRFIVFYNMFCT